MASMGMICRGKKLLLVWYATVEQLPVILFTASVVEPVCRKSHESHADGQISAAVKRHSNAGLLCLTI